MKRFRWWHKGLLFTLALGSALLLAALFADGNNDAMAAPAEAAMPASDTLVIYYSRTGTTATVAKEIAQRLGADQEAIYDTVDREGLFGFTRSILDAIRRRGTTLKPLHLDPTRYKLVIIGTPDWGKSMAAPTRTLLQTYQGRLNQVAFVLTDGTADHQAIFAEMAQLCGRDPVATLGIPQTEVAAGRYVEPVKAFLAKLPRRPSTQAMASSP